MTSNEVETAIRLVYPDLSDDDVKSVSGIMAEVGIEITVADESVILFCWLALAAAVDSIRKVEVKGLASRKREDMSVIIRAARTWEKT